MNRITEMLGCKYPIIQAPMGWIARSQLASAVSNAGGFGIIETSSGEVEQCKGEIKKMASLTNSPFGVNLPILFLADESMLDVVISENVKFHCDVIIRVPVKNAEFTLNVSVATGICLHEIYRQQLNSK